MTFRIILAICFCYLVQGFPEGIDVSQQCSNSTSPTTFPSECVISEDNRYNKCGCLNVLWTEFKPYSYQKDSTFRGIIPVFFQDLIRMCCYDTCWKVNLTGNVSRHEITTGTIQPYIDIVLPYSAASETKVRGMEFVPLVDNPSVVYITKRESVSAIPKRLIRAIWMAWPVLLIALLLSLLSGVLLWFLELWHNHDQFPHSFFKGSWEGFWWAFVSMTTVGYGDRAPKSILGRGFAILWIIIGICLLSIFTATLTTSLNTITLEEKKTLARSKVGAIRSSLEAYAGVINKAKVINYNTTEELWNAIYYDDVDGILLDSFVSATPEISKIIEKNDYKISQTVAVEERYYGILVRDMNLTKCFRDEIYYETGWYQSDHIYDIITERIDADSKPQENEATTRSNSILKPTKDVFYVTLFVCIAFIVVALIAGLSWEFFFKDKCYKNSKTGASPGIKANATNLEQMEREIIADIQNMFSALRAQRDFDIAGPMKVGDVELKIKRNSSQFGVAQQSTQQQKLPQQQP